MSTLLIVLLVLFLLGGDGWAGSTLLGSSGTQIVLMEDNMKPSTKDEVVGKVHEVNGKIKEKVGQLTSDPDLETEGTGDVTGSTFGERQGAHQELYSYSMFAT